MEQQNRRITGRWKVWMQAKVQLEGRDEYCDCVIADINFKGMQISLQEKLPADTHIKLKLALAPDLVLAVEVWVAWSKTQESRHTYGLVFSKIKDSDKEKIYNFVYKKTPHAIIKQWWQGVEIKKGEATMDDRRIFQRIPAQFPLNFLDLSSGREGQAEACDISAKGVGMVTSEALAPRTPLEMWLKLSEKSEPLYVRGEVIWFSQTEPAKYRAGVQLERAHLMAFTQLMNSI